jgi:hypothetical protein
VLENLEPRSSEEAGSTIFINFFDFVVDYDYDYDDDYVIVMDLVSLRVKRCRE